MTKSKENRKKNIYVRRSGGKERGMRRGGAKWKKRTRKCVEEGGDMMRA